MPRFSVIVPACHVRSRLHACLESVLSQPFEDLELIAVDSGCPEGAAPGSASPGSPSAAPADCAALVDEVAARDRRVVTLRVPADGPGHPGGAGSARNAGLDRATGDYVLFLDAADTLVPDALQTLADRLKETGSPDALLYGHARVSWAGVPQPGPGTRLLAPAGPAPFTLTDRPGLLRLPAAALSAAYSREFLERTGLRFPPGDHEHVPWTYPVLMAAGSLATLDRVCVHHHPRREPTSRRPLDLFDQYERLFSYVDERTALRRWRAPLFGRMADDLAALLRASSRLPRPQRAELARRARAHCRRHRTPGAATTGAARVRHALVRLGAHRLLRALTATRTLTARSVRGASTTWRGLRGALLRLHYRVQLLLPLRPGHAVFAAPGSPGYGGSPAALEQRVRELVPGARTAWVCTSPAHAATVPPGPRRLRPGTAAYWTALARSTYLVSDIGGLEERLVKRRGQVAVRTQRATPLGHEGLDLQHRPAARGATDAAALLRATAAWDHLVTAGRHATLVHERVFPGAYTTLEYGSPRTDVFRRATARDAAVVRTTLGVPEGHTAILYAPAHRDYVTPQPRLLDLERIALALGPRVMLLARTATPLPDHPRVIDVSGHPSAEELCLAADALITDYAPIMFDFASLDRPIVVHTEDWDAYAAARGTYFDLRAFPPGAVARSEDELIDIFTTGHWRGSRSTQLRTAFRARFCPNDDGHAAERVVRHVFLGEG